MLEFSRSKIIMILLVVFYGFYMALPNFLSDNQLKSVGGAISEKRLNLGLDLRGGVEMLLKIDRSDVIEMRLQALISDARQVRREESDVSEELAAMVASERGRSEIETTVDNYRFIQSVRKIQDRIVFQVRKTKDSANQEAYTDQVRQLIRPLVYGSNIDPLSTQVEELELIENGRTMSIRLTELGVEIQQDEAVARTIKVLRKRIDPSGTKEITLQQEGGTRILLQIPGENNVEDLKTLITKAAKLSFHSVVSNLSQQDMANGTIPPDVTVLPLSGGGQIAILNDVIVSGADLNKASPSSDENGRPSVSFDFNSNGGKKFADFTARNVGKPFAIRLDDEVISAPNIMSPILGGSGQITGVGKVADAVELATLLSSGSLPVDITFDSQKVVGPDLGKDSIQAGKIAVTIGFAAVIVFMIVAYGRFGIAANLGLIINLIMIVGALSLFQATLTLPGIAGIVLTIGMAVDANVLIFERIREEQKDGKKPYQAMQSGYEQAFSTIMDANITTFIAAFILYFLGTGPVQGFAVTLSIGILTSMFTAVLLTRLILSTWLKRTNPSTLPV